MTATGLPPAQVTGVIASLNRLARNLWWTWNQESQEIFQELSPRGWQNLFHNAVAVLHEVSEYELRVRLMDPAFATRVLEVLEKFDAYLGETDTWGRRHAPALLVNPVAYFTAEIGFHETLPIAAGGLGILAGDHAKSASDLGIGFAGVSLFYREGYFQQAINQDAWQTEYYSLLDPKLLPIEPVLDGRGNPLVCEIDIAMSRVFFQAWRVNVGRAAVYLLDTNRPENEQHYRDLTLRVYGGDSTTRIMQELLLGVGGLRLLRALGIEPSVFHINEGHAAFVILELVREKLAEGRPYREALAATRAQCIFTTHTPVEAGHDRFSPDLLSYVLHKYLAQLHLPLEEVLALGRVDPANGAETFCMTVLALKGSRSANGVSELHGQVSRRMWHPLYPGVPVEEVPIGHITNGIHLLFWMKGTVRRFWKRKLGEGWEKLWALRYMLRREMIEFTRRRLLLQERRISYADFIAFDQLLNPDALTIGFARRFATYKRAPLVFEQLDKIVRLASERPLQFVFAGKAHPRDDEGKRYIQQVIHLSKHSELKGSLVFIENYDVHVARQMISGCDVWLNTPRRPLEACGTSGQKVGCHGGLNLSILDGWWREGYDGANGFAIGPDSHPESIEEQDRRDGENLFSVLSEQVIPEFWERDGRGVPRQWIARMRRSMATLVPRFNTWRMVQEYTAKYYLAAPEVGSAAAVVESIER
ncbi:MAG: DUF3417 domain-containing protein [Acidobacteria bacterium]|nr:MAG: DUF3417 domain-containing protein [Acidobacteriota bacterium]